MKGKGHFKNWEKQQEEKAKAQRGRGQSQKQQSKSKSKKQTGAVKAQKVEEKESKPTYFDLAPLKEAIQGFLSIDAMTRWKIRKQFREIKDMVNIELFSSKDPETFEITPRQINI